jgi:hypothetical protein
MLNKLAAGLVAVAMLAAPVVGGLAAATPAAAATTVKVKTVKTHRHHLRNFRIVRCFMTGSQARQVRLHAGKGFQRVACYLPTQAKLHVRNHVRHAGKPVKHIKQVRHIKPAKTGRVG